MDAAQLEAIQLVDRFYVTRFGTYRVERNGRIVDILHDPTEKDQHDPLWDACHEARQRQDIFKPVGVHEEYGWIFERTVPE